MRKVAVSAVLLVFLALSVDAGENAWTSTGPLGGNILGFTFHPVKDNLVFVNTGSGPFRSRDGGPTWQRLEVGGDFDAAGFVMVHPKNQGRLIYVCASTFHSFDEGSTWKEISRDSITEGLQEVALDPSDPNTLYALSTLNGVLFKTTDAGKTWAKRCKGLPPEQGYRLIVDHKNADILYAAIGGRIYKSADAAVSWLPADGGLPGGGYSSLAMHPKDPQVLYAGTKNKDFYRTSDGGAHWTRMGPALDGLAQALSIDPKDPNKMYAAGVGFGNGSNAWRSSNGGASWSAMKVDPDKLLEIAAHPRTAGLVFAGGDDQGVLRSQDGGATWRSANKGLKSFATLKLVANAKRIVAGSSLVRQFQSTNQGKSWQRLEFGQRNILAKDVQVCAGNPDLIVACGVFGRRKALAISKDGGKSWQFPYSFEDASFVRLDPENPATIYLAHNGQISNLSGVAKSTDEGQTWTVMNAGLADKAITSFALDPRNGQTLAAGTESGRIFVSTDGGATWKNKSGGLTGAQVDFIAIDPRAASTIYLIAKENLYKTTNGGKTWIRKAENVSALSIDSLDSSTIYAGAFGGPLVSKDEGETWSPFAKKGLGSFKTYSLLRHPADKNIFLLGTGAGVFTYSGKSAAAVLVP
jgi:photosystem II stability/assembly factor-like uncharacterized protein